MVFSRDSIARTPPHERGKTMDALTTEAAAAEDTSNGVEQQRLPEQKTRQRMELDAEKIRSSIARLSSSSVGELEGLASELRKLDEFLKTETSYIQREIEGALAGIKIITEAISPWRQPVPTMPQSRQLRHRSPPLDIDIRQSRGGGTVASSEALVKGHSCRRTSMARWQELAVITAGLGIFAIAALIVTHTVS